MKPIPAIFLILCGAIAGGTIVHLSEHKTPPAAAPLAESSPVPPMPPPEKIAAPKPEPPPAVAAEAAAPAKTSAVPVAVEAKPDDATNSIHQLVDALLTAKSAVEKHNLFQQLLKDGQPDKALATWQLGLTKFPNDPALLKKISGP